MKEFRWYIVALFAGLVLVVAMELNTPHPIDWSPSFKRTARSPYGSYLLYHFLETTLKRAQVSPTPLTTFETFGSYEDEEERNGDTNYIVINSDYLADDASVDRLLAFVAHGNKAFIAATEMPRKLMDTLGLDIDPDIFMVENFDASLSRQQKFSSITFTDPSLGAQRSFRIEEELSGGHFSKLDTERTVVLARRADKDPDFIRIGFGQGEFLLCSAPFLFTNYAIVDSATEHFPFLALSYLPVQTTLWDEYYKAGHVANQSHLDYILNQPALAWSYYLLLATILLFVFVYGRRRQRIIPIVARPTNSTMEFVSTVGRLYFQHGDHKNLAQKKILYLLDYIQSHYGLRAQNRDEAFLERLAERSELPRRTIDTLFTRIAAVEQKQKISENELATLVTAIDNFYLKQMDS